MVSNLFDADLLVAVSPLEEVPGGVAGRALIPTELPPLPPLAPFTVVVVTNVGQVATAEVTRRAGGREPPGPPAQGGGEEEHRARTLTTVQY